MHSFKKSLLWLLLKTAKAIFNFLPLGLGLWVGRLLGLVGYSFLPKKRAVVYANLKTAFSSKLSPEALRLLSLSVFVNFGQVFIELLALSKMKRLGFERFVDVQGKENLDEALKRGRGVILLAVHSGSWELASIVGSLMGQPYHVVVNDQFKTPELDKLLNEDRAMTGAHVIFVGKSREIIHALKNNEIISLVLDQGGRGGVAAPFLGKRASFSTGAIRLALKHQSAICPVWITRRAYGKHILRFFPALPLTPCGNTEKDIEFHLLKAAGFFEGLLREHPQEYLWFYKVYKYSNQAVIMIIDDGRTGHLRQSQAVSYRLRQMLQKKGKTPQEYTLSLQWRSLKARRLFVLYAYLSQYLGFLRREDCLRRFLEKSCYDDLMKVKGDFVISCGFTGAGVNYILSQNHLAKSISILTSGLLSRHRFDGVASLKELKIAPNLISPVYLKDQAEGLMKRYPHLKGNVRTKFGILIGGNTRDVLFDEKKMRVLISQIKESAVHYNADILLTTSRRTPLSVEQIIQKELKGFPRALLCIIANQRNVPEAIGGILALSDLVIVSGESISMVSEGISSGKPTIVFSPNKPYTFKPRNKYEDFVLKLSNQGYVMACEAKNLSASIACLLSRKITLKTLDNHNEIQKCLEKVC